LRQQSVRQSRVLLFEKQDAKKVGFKPAFFLAEGIVRLTPCEAQEIGYCTIDTSEACRPVSVFGDLPPKVFKTFFLQQQLAFVGCGLDR